MEQRSSKLLFIILAFFLLSQPSLAGSISGQVNSLFHAKKIIVYLSQSNSSKPSPSSTKHHISQNNTKFSHPLLIITSGDSIEWSNDETKEIDHNIFSLNNLNHFDLGLGEKGSTLTQAFKGTGMQNYYCSVHKDMEGKIIILPNRYYQFLSQPSHFKIDNIPEGNWTLNALVFHRRYKVEPLKLNIGTNDIKNIRLEIIKR